MKRIGELTGLRCVAISLVLLGHSGQIMPRGMRRLLYGDFGDTGVQIFFVLSGFLITTILLSEYDRTGRINFRAFYRRRFLRILPAFYTYLAVIAAFAGAGLIKAGWQQFVIAGTFIWNYSHFLGIDGSFQRFSGGDWYLGHSWTLALEEQFYWVWPAVFLLIARHNLRRLLGGIILVVPIIRMASYVLAPHDRGQLHMMFHTGIDTILVGCFFAVHRSYLERRWHHIMDSGTALWILICVIFLVLPAVEARLGGYWIATYGATFAAASIGLLILSVLRQPKHGFSKMLRSSPFLFIGTISYSLYLWQQLFNHADSPVFLKFPLSILGSAGMACLSYYLIERPFLLLKDRVPKKSGMIAANARERVGTPD